MRDYLKKIFQPLSFIFLIIYGKEKKLQHSRQHLSEKER
jgi:hypothetical protein